MSGTYVFPDTSERDCLNVVIQYEFTSRHNVRFYEGLWETCRGHRATVVQTNGYNNDENNLAHKNKHPWFPSDFVEQQECRKEISKYRTENYDTFCSDTKNWKIYKQMTYLLPSLLVTQGDVVVVFDFWRLNDFFLQYILLLTIFHYHSSYWSKHSETLSFEKSFSAGKLHANQKIEQNILRWHEWFPLKFLLNNVNIPFFSFPQKDSKRYNILRWLLVPIHPFVRMVWSSLIQESWRVQHTVFKEEVWRI